eukprot:m.202579 g.202579  ORF g.202579 m.202579 type:complete len:465 (+) comp14977_c1_seq14:3016-4410(+)
MSAFTGDITSMMMDEDDTGRSSPHSDGAREELSVPRVAFGDTSEEIIQTREGPVHVIGLENLPPPPEGTSSAASAIFNFVNSIVGAGIIGMPFALKEAGFGFGIFLILFMGMITDYSIRLLVRTGNHLRMHTYQDLVHMSLGRWAFHLLSFAQFMFPIFGMIAYGIIVGQTLPKVFTVILGESFLSNPKVVIAVMTLFFMLPLSANKHIEALGKWSAVSLCGVTILIIIVVAAGVKEGAAENTTGDLTVFNSRFVQAIGVMAFAYVCHHNTFLIYMSLKERTEKNFGKVTHISVGVSASLSVLLGVGGYLAFRDNTKDDVLDNFPEDHKAATVARLFFALAIMLTYPIECFVAREVIENYFFENSPLTDTRHYTVTVLICLFCMIIAVSVNNLGIVLELNGVINANMIAFILPGLIGAVSLPGERFYKGARLWATLLVTFGVMVFVVGIIEIAIEYGSSSGDDE